ncbi:ParB/RepB/Spo0J family partition protein [Aquimonas voraii]|jgi:ParB/RepB/Spo0J family partition protein|uniref:ParB/RepB/Spo0J family partition protein n=1 Tax=Aquimonas voraii TaxID=265719 RepID=A0A1G6ZTX2_9GAMM|nr:ParB/RepB/Spo0J family partition protein [Aquimonas voraii]SDE05295.1 ParB/RepB/Spo0J family partition protein [Aquimonas voraii]
MATFRERALARHQAEQKRLQEQGADSEAASASTTGPISPKVQTAGPAAMLKAAIEQLPVKATMPIAVTTLHVRPGYERHPDEFAGPEWEAFVASIETSKGNLQPIDVREVRGGPTLYQVIAGERRFRALLQLGHKTALCAVREVDDAMADFIHDTENAKRADKSPYSLALQLVKMMESGRYGSQKELAERLGRNAGDVSRLLRLIDDAPKGTWERIKDPVAVAHRDVTLLLKVYEKPEFVEYISKLDPRAPSPIAAVLKRAKEVLKRPKAEKTLVQKIREVERGDAFHLVLPKELPASMRTKILEYARKLADEAVKD